MLRDRGHKRSEVKCALIHYCVMCAAKAAPLHSESGYDATFPTVRRLDARQGRPALEQHSEEPCSPEEPPASSGLPRPDTHGQAATVNDAWPNTASPLT